MKYEDYVEAAKSTWPVIEQLANNDDLVPTIKELIAPEIEMSICEFFTIDTLKRRFLRFIDEYLSELIKFGRIEEKKFDGHNIMIKSDGIHTEIENRKMVCETHIVWHLKIYCDNDVLNLSVPIAKFRDYAGE